MSKPGRNDPCPCGSGKKFKKCCESKTTKSLLGSAQVLTSSNKISSLFQQNVTPVKPKLPEVPPDEKHFNM
ncbi:MAG: SEC-C domain-containing protein [Rhabdochlamydiaceae bacterium]|jgi:hypothetical protein